MSNGVNTKISITFIFVIIAIFAFTFLFPAPVYASVVCWYDGEDCSLGCKRMCTAQSAGCCECFRRLVCEVRNTSSVKKVEDLLSDSGVSEAGIDEITKALGVGIEQEKLKAMISLHVEEDAQAVFEEIVKLAENETPIELPKPGLTPESPFYFLDRFREAIQEFFTFNPESKVKLQTNLAAERIAEIQAMLEKKGVEAKGLEVAQARLEGHADRATAIVLQEKQKGKDVSQLAGELSDSLYAQRRMMKQVFNKKEQELEVERSRLFGLSLDATLLEDNELKSKHDIEMNSIQNMKAGIKEKESSTTTALNVQNDILKDMLDEEKRRESEVRDAAAAAQKSFQETIERENQLQKKERRKAIERSVQSSSRSLPSVICQSGWHEFLAGVDDNFAGGTEPAIPSPGLQLFMNPSHRDFDEGDSNKLFGHTFEDIAPSQAMGTIEEAFLEFRIKPNYAYNDSISLRFTGSDGNPLAGGWNRPIGDYYGTPGILSVGWTSHNLVLLELNLASLPNLDGSATDLIAELNAQDFLDLYIQDDTVIDYAKLRVRHSCLPSIDIAEPIEPFCAEDLWVCGRWGDCSAAGKQTRTCTLVTDCPGIRTPKPVEEQTCRVPAIGVEPSPEPICIEDIWECGRWSECSVAGTQIRTCTLKTDCAFAQTPKPIESQTCEPPPPSCTEANQSCGEGLPSCCEGLTCEPSFGAYGTCQVQPPQEPPDLKVEKFEGSEFHFDGSASYTIQVENVGSGTATGQIVITDDLPDGLTYVSFSSDPYSTDWSCGASGQKVICVYTGPDILPGGALPTLIINVTIASTDDFPAVGDQVINCVTVEHSDDIKLDNNSSCITSIITVR